MAWVSVVRQAEPGGAGDDATGALAAHERLSDDAADGRDTVLGGDRGLHLACLSLRVGRSRLRPESPAECGKISVDPPICLRS